MGKKQKNNNDEDSNLKTVKQNQKLIDKLAKTKAKRHVKVKNEPIFDSMLNTLQNDYAKEVVSRSSIEMLKEIDKDDF